MLKFCQDDWLELKAIKEADLEFLFAGRNKRDVQAWCRQVGPLHWERHKDWYFWQAQEDSVRMFTIWDGITVVGCCGLTSIDWINRRAEFSLWVDPDFRGKQRAKKALLTLFRFGFDELNLNRIWGETFEHNPAKHLFEKLGMIEEGRRIEFYYRDGRYIDAILYSVGRHEFSAALSPEEARPVEAETG